MVAAVSARSTDGLKRESGENPEQNPLLYFPLYMSMLSFKIIATGDITLGRQDNGDGIATRPEG